MAGRPARLRFRNAPHVTMTNVHNFTRTVRYNGDIEVDPAKLAVTGAEPTYLNYDWVLEDGATLLAGKTMTVAGDINFSAAQTLEELVTFKKGLEIDTVGLEVAAGGAEAAGNVSATAGSISAGTTVIAPGNITATTGNITASAGNIVAGAAIQAGGNIQAGTDFNVTAGGLLVSAGDVNCHDQIEAVAGNIIASGAGNGAVEATAGSITAVTGDVTATTGGVAITGSGDLQVDAGNITASANVTATAGAIEAGTTITAGTALGVVDPLAVTNTITGTALGYMEWNGTAVTGAGGTFVRTLYTRNVNLAAAATGTISEAAVPLNGRVVVDGILNGYVSGDVANANIGSAYVVRVFGEWENVGGVVAVAAAYVTAQEVIHNGLVPASTLPVFTTDVNVANWRITVDNGNDGAAVNNHILWRGELRVVTTAV